LVIFFVALVFHGLQRQASRGANQVCIIPRLEALVCASTKSLEHLLLSVLYRVKGTYAWDQ